MSELFTVPAQLSPRLKWMGDHGIQTREYGQDKEAFIAPACIEFIENQGDLVHTQGDLLRGLDKFHGELLKRGLLCYYEIELDSIITLAQRNSLRLWNEEDAK